MVVLEKPVGRPLVSVGYARNGMGKGVITDMRDKTLVNVGILANGRWPLWIDSLSLGNFNLRWIMGAVGKWTEQKFPNTLLYTENIVDEIVTAYPVTIMLCEKRAPPLRCSAWRSEALKIIVSAGGEKLRNDAPGWFGHREKIKHALHGGVTDGDWSVSVWTRNSKEENLFVFDAVPRASLQSALSEKEKGRPVGAPPEGNSLIPRVMRVREGVYSTRNGLFSVKSKPSDLYIVRSFKSPTGWCERKLTPNERLNVWDVREVQDRNQLQIFDTLGVQDQGSSWVPMRIRFDLLRRVSALISESDHKAGRKRLPLEAEDQDKRADPGCNVGLKRLRDDHHDELGSEVADATDEGKRSNANLAFGPAIGDRNQKAAKADDAEIPYWIWNNRVKDVFNTWDTRPSDESVDNSLEAMRRFFHRVWVKRLCHSFRKWLKGYNKPWVNQANSVEAGIDALCRAINSSWWEWDNGSRLFFWRWPAEVLDEVRDGTKPFFRRDPPCWVKPQRVPTDPAK